jgi:hypothetical protein
VTAPPPPGPRPGDPLAVLAAFLDPPEPGVLVEVDRDQAAAIVGEVHAARAVVQAARLVGHQGLDETAVAERLADALDAYDHATGQVAS